MRLEYFIRTHIWDHIGPIFNKAETRGYNCPLSQLHLSRFCHSNRLAHPTEGADVEPNRDECKPLVGLMDSARHGIKRILNPRSLSEMATYDVATTIYQSVQQGVRGPEGLPDERDPAAAAQGATVDAADAGLLPAAVGTDG